MEVGGYGGFITASVLGALWLALAGLDMSQTQAVTVSFLTLAFAQLWHVFDMRDRGSHILRNDVVKNPYVWGALLLCIGLLLLAVYVPFLADLLSVVNPGLEGWGLVIGMSMLPLIVSQILKRLRIL
jgi:Ca2+-transporting ATPase